MNKMLYETRTWPWARVADVEEARWAALWLSATRVIGESYAAQAPDDSPARLRALEHVTAALLAVKAPSESEDGDGSGRTGSAAGRSGVANGRDCGWAREGVRELAEGGFKLHAYGQKHTPPVFVGGETEGKERGWVSLGSATSSAAPAAGPAVRGDSREMGPYGEFGGGAPLAMTAIDGGGAGRVGGKSTSAAATGGGGGSVQTDGAGDSTGGRWLTFAIVQSEGPHKRTVHWVPELQTGAMPPLGEEAAAEEATVISSTTGAATAARAVARRSGGRTVKELRAECKARGLPVSGRKVELEARIADHTSQS